MHKNYLILLTIKLNLVRKLGYIGYISKIRIYIELGYMDCRLIF